MLLAKVEEESGNRWMEVEIVPLIELPTEEWTFENVGRVEITARPTKLLGRIEDLTGEKVKLLKVIDPDQEYTIYEIEDDQVVEEIDNE